MLECHIPVARGRCDHAGMIRKPGVPRSEAQRLDAELTRFVDAIRFERRPRHNVRRVNARAALVRCFRSKVRLFRMDALIRIEKGQIQIGIHTLCLSELLRRADECVLFFGFFLPAA